MNAPRWRGLARYTPLLLFLALAVTGIKWGVEGNFHPDELTKFALHIIRERTLDPPTFIYPSLPIYLSALVALPFAPLGAGAALLADRSLSVGLLLLTLLVSARTARAAFGERAVLPALVLSGVTTGLVAHAHFATADAFQILGVALTTNAAVRLTKDGSPRAYAWCGVALGLSTGAKYVGVIGVVPIVVAHLAARRAHRKLLTALGLALVTFVATAPYTLVHPAAFARDVAGLQGVVGAMGGLARGSANLLSVLWALLGPHGFAALGLVAVGATRLARRFPLALLGIGALAFALPVATNPSASIRYALPVVVALLPAFGLLTRRAVVPLLLVGVVQCGLLDFRFLRDGRYDARAWLKRAPAAKVAATPYAVLEKDFVRLPRPDERPETLEGRRRGWVVWLRRTFHVEPRRVPPRSERVYAAWLSGDASARFVVTSSNFTKRFARADYAKHWPKATAFYRKLDGGELPYRDVRRFRALPANLLIPTAEFLDPLIAIYEKLDGR